MPQRFNALYLETTRNCNFSCTFCSTGSKNKNKYQDVELRKIIDNVLVPAKELGTSFVDFSGGEFLLRKDYKEILKKAVELDFVIGIASNGSTLDDETLDELRNIVSDNLIISLGINSFDSENEKTREVNFEYVNNIIERISKHNFRINLSVTIGEFNKRSFIDTVEKIKEYKFAFNRIPFVPRSCNAHDLMINRDSLRDSFHPILRKYFNGQVSYTPYFLPQNVYESVSGQDLNIDQIPLNPAIGCWVGAYYAINPEGEVAPCPMFLDHVTAGNVYKTPLKEILFESELFQKITDRKNLEGKCGNCKFTYTCGGCRVMAFYKTGNVYAEDPTCFINDLSVEELCRAEEETIKSFKNYVRMAKFGNLFNNPKTKK
jgi:radical SAM protein with 4Fe4S-binding SPASM domain